MCLGRKRTTVPRFNLPDFFTTKSQDKSHGGTDKVFVEEHSTAQDTYPNAPPLSHRHAERDWRGLNLEKESGSMEKEESGSVEQEDDERGSVEQEDSENGSGKQKEGKRGDKEQKEGMEH
ncbi:hypothetical protein NDU88_004322 [Pleurodeles waltl]|uniref:Uncharacterized protein n=1 Tax=Pleurodeles waltl TaxID=8319 RepID=A0AAV7SIF1_PLEWA|nr:hypothetical protein NDU88_004322 [Pleurodeles waltl]